jgi:hypothetical protein
VNEEVKEGKTKRKCLMDKLSKKMVKDYQQTKKKSIIYSSGTHVNINESRLKEEYEDGRTIFKISKQKSLSPFNSGNQPAKGILKRQKSQDSSYDGDESIDSYDGSKQPLKNNLSVRFNRLSVESEDNRRNNNDSLEESKSYKPLNNSSY